MTNPIERERIARELAEELGYKIDAQGDWYCPVILDARFVQPRGRSWLDIRVQEALIDARCRIAELEAALQGIVERFENEDRQAGNESFDARRSPLAWAMYTDAKARLALREKEPK